MDIPQGPKLNGDFIANVRVDLVREQLDVCMPSFDFAQVGERSLQPFSKNLATGVRDKVLLNEACGTISAVQSVNDRGTHCKASTRTCSCSVEVQSP